MDSHLRNTIFKATRAKDLHLIGTIQSLWSGYDSLDRHGLIGAESASVLVKHMFASHNAVNILGAGIQIFHTNINCLLTGRETGKTNDCECVKQYTYQNLSD